VMRSYAAIQRATIKMLLAFDRAAVEAEIRRRLAQVRLRWSKEKNGTQPATPDRR